MPGLQYYHFLPLDASLTLQNIDQLLTEVLDWNTLGTKLGLPDYCLGEIKIDYHAYGTRRQRKEMISKWLQSDTEASWSRLASALEKMGNKTVAKNIWSQYVPGYKSRFVRDYNSIAIWFTRIEL